MNYMVLGFGFFYLTIGLGLLVFSFYMKPGETAVVNRKFVVQDGFLLLLAGVWIFAQSVWDVNFADRVEADKTPKRVQKRDMTVPTCRMPYASLKKLCKWKNVRSLSFVDCCRQSSVTQGKEARRR